MVVGWIFTLTSSIVVQRPHQLLSRPGGSKMTLQAPSDQAWDEITL